MTATSATATEHGNVLLMLGPADPDGDSVYRALTADEARSLSVELDDAADQLELAEGVSGDVSAQSAGPEHQARRVV